MNSDWLTGSPWPMLGLVFGGLTVLTLVAILWSRATVAAEERLLREGEPAEATVLAVRDTGWREMNRCVFTVELEVRRPGQAPHRAEARLLLPQPWSPAPYPAGSVVEVRVDPARPARAAIAGLSRSPGLGSFSVGNLAGGSVVMVNGRVVEGGPLPPAAAEALRQAEALLGDADRDGTPDLFQGAFQGASPAPRPTAERLRELQAMRDEGLISADEYERKRAQILEQL